MMYLKNKTCPECKTKGLVLIDGNFYNCDECNNYWVIPESDKKTIDKLASKLKDKD